MLDTRPDTHDATFAPLLARPFGEIVDAIADGDTPARDGSVAAIASATSAGCLVAACTDLADLPECQPRLLELARVLARARYLRQRLPAQVDEAGAADLALVQARALPFRDAHDYASRRSAVQVALKRTLDRRLTLAAVGVELAEMAREVQVLAGGRHASLTKLAETLAASALSWTLETVERELDAEAEPWTRQYVGSELERLRRASGHN